MSYKLIIKRQTTSYTSDTQSSIRGILKLEPRTILSKNKDTVSNVSGHAAIMYYAKPDLNIFDPYDKRLAILSNEGTDACPFWSALYREELNKGGTFTFTVPATHHDSRFVMAENKVAFRDKDDNLRLFVIKETEEKDGENGPLIEVYCDPEYIDELNDIVIEDKRPQNRTAEYALGQVLEESRWKVGEVAELGINSTNFYFMTGIESINRILDVWGGEIRDRIEVESNKITGRYIDILTRRGADTGKRWEIDKDIIEITRLTQSYPKTALYGRGASLETEGGGFSRLLSFEDVEWSVANGDQVDKQLGQKWVGDMDALQYYGRRMIGGRNYFALSQAYSYPNYAVLESIEGTKITLRIVREETDQTNIALRSGNYRAEPNTDYTISGFVTWNDNPIPSNFFTRFYTRRSSEFDILSVYVDEDTGYFEAKVRSIEGYSYFIHTQTLAQKGDIVVFDRLKIEKGTIATDWSPAPEDVFNDASYHRMGIFENGNIEDPEELLWATWNELQEQKRPFENYTLDVLLYAKKAGLDHEKVRLGDTSIALDRRFARPIEVEERIIAYEYDVANPDDTGKVELGQFRELFSDEKRLDKMQEQLDNAQGKANHPEIDDDSFPDVKPDTPDNFTAEGLFKVIQLKWDFNASSYIASYELYASQTPNFNPTPETLVWRGKTGGYAFEADTDEQWYFRLRAVNTHGTASDFTSEISAQTIKINAGIDVAPYTITDQLIAQNANIDGAKIGDATITSAKIANLIGDLITAGIIKDANDRVLFNLDDGIININDGAIKITRPDGAVWLEDGMVHKDYDISGQDPHFMGEVSTPGGYEPAFQQMPGSGGYYGAHTGVIDGSEPYSEDIRDQDKGYTVNFQRYWFMHSARYFILRLQPSARTKGLERLRVRMYESDTQLLTQDIESSGFGSWYPLVVDLGKPTYTERRIDFRIGFLRQWKIPNHDAIVFRISRTYQTDFI